MSYHVYFSFSTSLRETMRVPKGALDRIWSRIKYTEQTLGLERTPTYTPKGEEQKPGWSWRSPESDMLVTAGQAADPSSPGWHLTNRAREQRIEKMADAVDLHNDEVRRLYEDED